MVPLFIQILPVLFLVNVYVIAPLTQRKKKRRKAPEKMLKT